MQAGNNPEVYRNQTEIKTAIEAAKGKVVISDKALTSADINFLKEGEIKFDTVNSTLAIRVNGEILVTRFSNVNRVTQDGKGTATSAGLDVTFDHAMPSADYTLHVDCFTDETFSTQVSFAISSRTKTGFHLAPLENCVYQFIVSGKA